MAFDPACGVCRHTGRLGKRVGDRRGLRVAMEAVHASLAWSAATQTDTGGASWREQRPWRRSALGLPPSQALGAAFSATLGVAQGPRRAGGPTHALKRWSARAAPTPARLRVGRVDLVAHSAGT
jgi:hypothetical protein